MAARGQPKTECYWRQDAANEEQEYGNVGPIPKCGHPYAEHHEYAREYAADGQNFPRVLGSYPVAYPSCGGHEEGGSDHIACRGCPECSKREIERISTVGVEPKRWETDVQRDDQGGGCQEKAHDGKRTDKHAAGGTGHSGSVARYPSRVKWPLLLTTIAFFLAGAALGYASLAGGPLPAATAVIFLVLLLTRFRTRPEQPGAYMLGAGLAGAAILLKVIADCSPPACHYEVITPIVGVLFVVIATCGAGLLVRAVMRHRFST